MLAIRLHSLIASAAVVATMAAGVIVAGAIVVSAGLVVPSAAHAQASRAGDLPADRHRQVDALFAPWSATSTPGCAVAMARDGQVDYARGYGMANLEFDIAISPESRFHVASVSKQFTAFAIGLLAQDGRLSFDDDVRKHLPELPDTGHHVTIAQMLHHTAGMREEFHVMYLAGWRYDDPRNEADALWIATRQRALNYVPGSESLYTNTHYTLLGMVVRRLTGLSLRQFADERIFRPLGMTDTAFQDGHTESARRRASGYRPHERGGWRVSLPRSDQNGASNLMTTVGDLLKWQENLRTARVGGRALVDWLQTSATLNDGSPTGYGGGLRIGTYRGLRTVGHDGADAGYRSDVVSFPDQRLDIVALCNGSTLAPGDLTRKIADIYLGDRMRPFMPPAVTVPAAQLATLAGTWWNAVEDAVVRLEVKDGALRAVGSADPLVPIGDGLFRLTGTTNEWRFAAPAAPAASLAPGAAAGTPTPAPRELRITDAWPTPRLFTRLTAPVPSGAALAAYTGAYRSDELEVTYRVVVEKGKLVVRWGREMTLTLEAVGGDHFIDGIYTVSFTRGKRGAVDGLTISTRRVRRLRAARV